MRKSVIILVHFVFWLCLYWFVFAITKQFHELIRFETNIYWHAFVLALGCIVPVYSGYILYPRLFSKKHVIPWAISGVVFLAVFSFVAIMLDDGFTYLSFENYSTTLIYTTTISFIGGGLRSLFQFVEHKKKQEELEKQNLKSELALLKTQLNPHFLFNTLNNIDVLIFEDQDKASEFLAKLSDIMRYMLKNTKDDFVELREEVAYLKNYIELEKLRLKNKDFVKFNVQGNINNIRIASMLMLPFVENAFKHSVSGINISLAIENNIFTFVCENGVDDIEFDKGNVRGMGLDVLKKRLELIYPQNHNLTIKTENLTFRATLKIDFNEN